jgi:hypothetical protein
MDFCIILMKCIKIMNIYRVNEDNNLCNIKFNSFIGGHYGKQQ